MVYLLPIENQEAVEKELVEQSIKFYEGLLELPWSFNKYTSSRDISTPKLDELYGYHPDSETILYLLEEYRYEAKDALEDLNNKSFWETPYIWYKDLYLRHPYKEVIYIHPSRLSLYKSSIPTPFIYWNEYEHRRFITDKEDVLTFIALFIEHKDELDRWIVRHSSNILYKEEVEIEKKSILSSIEVWKVNTIEWLEKNPNGLVYIL